MRRTLTRRFFVINMAGAMASLAVACQSQEVPVPPKPAESKPAAPAPPPTSGQAAPASGQAAPAKPAESKPAEAAKPADPKPAAAAQPTQAPAQAASTKPAEVARKDTLIMSVSDTFNQFQDAGLFNPFLRGQQRTGWQFAFEPFFFYNPYWTPEVTWPAGLPGKGNEIPWLAESYQYNPDSTEITLKLRPGVTWSDGKPFTSQDVAFTIKMLQDSAPDLLFSFEMKTWVKEVQAPDPQTVKFVLTRPNAQFVSLYFQWYLDLGFPMVPRHIFEGKDPKTFTNLDIEQGWPVTTGPWKLIFASADQKIYDRNDDWWGAKTGFRRLPAMKRVIVLPRVEDDKKIQMLIANQADTTHVMADSAISPLLQRNDKIRFWTADNRAPYGVASGANTIVGFNCSRPPYDDPDIRWAVNLALDRKQVNDVVYRGTLETAALPFAPLPTLKPFADAAGSLLEKYPVDKSDPAKSAQLMESKGWKKDAEGFWAKDGNRFPAVIIMSPGFFQDMAPVMVAQLRKAGFDASFKQLANQSQLVAQGDTDIYMKFDISVYSDPWVSLDQYHSRYFRETGQDATIPFRWKDPEFDKLVEQMGALRNDDPKFMQLYLQALEMWLKNLPVLHFMVWYLPIPFNTTYWKGWPNEKNPYVGGGDWHRGGASLLIHGVEQV
jgi:peptide/nickel transport system substrate-binding protein